MSLLNVSAISKKQGEDLLLKNINFVQESFQNIAIAGATGSGKTTLLKIIAGLVQPDKGEVVFEGMKVKGPNEKLLPGHPYIAYLSQHFELRNHYRVEELLQMANKLSVSDAALIFEVCRISHLLTRWTNELSGGERQRIALARTLVTAPQLLLLDEPFSNLDAIHKNILKKVISDISKQLNVTCILVSHDPVDVLSWASEIIVLDRGTIIQRGSPEEVYNNPLSEYVAALFGKYVLMNDVLATTFSYKGNKRFFRPRNFKIDAVNGIEAEVMQSFFMGSFYEITVCINGLTLPVYDRHSCNAGEKVGVTLLADE